jgi:hypothetical protein
MWESLLSELCEVRNEAEIASPRGRRLFRHWQDLCCAQALPPRASFDPIDVPWSLGYLSMVEVVPGDYVFRVDSTHAVDFFGAEMTGKPLSAYPDLLRRPRIRTAYDTVVSSGRPHAWLREMEMGRKRWRVEQVMLPFAGEGACVTHIAIALDTTLDRFEAAAQ